MMRGVLPIELHIRSFDRQAAAGRHGIARVNDQIYQHLFDLSRIRLYLSQIRSQFSGQRDVLADQPAQHLVHV